MNRFHRITEKLTAALQPTVLELRDVSHTHAGHVHAGTETHFTLTIASASFAGLTRVQQHQLVNNVLADEFDSGLHALSIKAIKS